MLRYLTALTLLYTAQTAASPAPASLQAERFVAWAPDWGSRTVKAAGLTLKVEPHSCGDGRPVSEGCGSGGRYVVVNLQTPDGQSAFVSSAAGYVHYIGVGRLGARARRPSVILITDGGGSGGCVHIEMAVPDGAGYRTGHLHRPGGGSDTFCAFDAAKLAWPHNLAGHGRAELLLADDRFDCAFTSCAGTWHPPRVIAIDGLATTDVSADPALASLFRADMAKARAACEHKIIEPAGPCAGFAADAARLGLLAKAWPVIEAQVRRGCREQNTTGCSSGYFIPQSFLADLRTFLDQSGYTPKKSSELGILMPEQVAMTAPHPE